MKKVLLSILALGGVFNSYSQFISLTSPTQVINENFDGLSATGTTQTTLPSGWWIAEQGTSGNTTYRAGDGSVNSGDTYSFGTGTNTDRSFGGIASGSVLPIFGVKIVNNTGNTISNFKYDLFMEQWRCGGRTDKDSLYFSYGLNAGVSGVFTRVPSNDLLSKTTVGTATALDGNLSANRQYYNFTISGLTWANGDTLYLRWADPNVAGSDDGLSIDNFNFSITGALPVQFKSFTATKANDGVAVKWATASELNNKGFEVQRSVNGAKYATIGFVKGAGNSNAVNNYSFVDTDKNMGNVCYRIKQVDFDGKSEFTKTACVIVEAAKEIKTMLVTPNPFKGNLDVVYRSNVSGQATIQLVDMLGKVHLQTQEFVSLGENAIHLNTEALPEGIYFIRFDNGTSVETMRLVKR